MRGGADATSLAAAGGGAELPDLSDLAEELHKRCARPEAMLDVVAVLSEAGVPRSLPGRRLSNSGLRPQAGAARAHGCSHGLVPAQGRSWKISYKSDIIFYR